MVEVKPVTLSINISKNDFHFIQHTIPHIARSCNYPFTEILLLIDASQPRSFFKDRKVNVSTEELLKKCREIASPFAKAKVREIDYSQMKISRVMQKYFGRPIGTIKDFRGALVYGFLACIEDAEAEYVVHFDCDILLHSDPEYSWVQEGIDLLDRYEEIISVSPLPGPPRKDRNLMQDEYVHWKFDTRGFYKFKEFTTRKFMVKKSKFDRLLPLPIKHISLKRYLWAKIFGGSSLLALEQLISLQLKQSQFYRGDISCGKSWTLHPPDHDEKFCNYLPGLIELVEEGKYPEENAGKYDLDLEAFIPLIESSRVH